MFSLFGISCEIVMPKQVVESLACWNRDIGWHWIAVMYHVDYLERTEPIELSRGRKAPSLS